MTIVRAQIKLVDEGVAAEPFQAVAKAKHNVAHGHGAIKNKPDATEADIVQQRRQSCGSFVLVKHVAIEGVVLTHQLKQDCKVRFLRLAK